MSSWKQEIYIEATADEAGNSARRIKPSLNELMLETLISAKQVGVRYSVGVLGVLRGLLPLPHK